MNADELLKLSDDEIKKRGLDYMLGNPSMGPMFHQGIALLEFAYKRENAQHAAAAMSAQEEMMKATRSAGRATWAMVLILLVQIAVGLASVRRGAGTESDRHGDRPAVQDTAKAGAN